MTLLAFGFGVFCGLIGAIKFLEIACPKGLKLYEEQLRKEDAE